MRSFAFIFPLFCGLAWNANAPVARAQTQKIRVRIQENTSQITVRGLDLSVIDNDQGEGFKTAVAALKGKTRGQTGWLFTCEASQIKAQQIAGDALGTVVTMRAPVTLESPSGFLSFRGNSFREKFRIFSNGKSCDLVNILDLEKYLSGLVNAEFNSQWSPESIAAQVIAARTYALFQMNRRQIRYDLESNERDQMYLGSEIEDTQASRAVARTRGMYLSAGPRDLAPIKAFYHSTCGGATELPERVWGSPFPGYKKRVKCPYCAPSPRYQWKAEFTGQDLAFFLYKGAQSDGIASALGWPKNWAEVLRRSDLLAVRSDLVSNSERIEKLRLTWRDRETQARFDLPVSGPRLRSWVGNNRLLSASFSVQSNGPGKWKFLGQGFGHGVGLCQWGAKTMGEKGFTAQQILKFYYPDATIQSEATSHVQSSL